MRGRWYLGKCCLKTDSGLLLKKFVRTARTLFWAANFCACSPGCYVTFISWTLFELSSVRISLKSITVLLSSFGRFLPSCFSVFLLVFIFLFLLCFFPKTQKEQKYFCCFSSPFVYFGFLLLSCFICYRWFAIRKSKKILLCLLVSFCSCSQFENTKNICCFSLVL